MLFNVLLVLCISYVYSGQPCPNRTDIHPCICMDKDIGKNKYENVVVCNQMTNEDLQNPLRRTLHVMEIDRLILYDTFLSDPPLQKNTLSFISSFRAREIKVVDSTFPTYSCPPVDICGLEKRLKRYVAINTTVTENTNCSSIHEWISCSESIEFIEIKDCYRKNHTLKQDFFFFPLTNLKVLRMPYNRITRIDRRAFTNTKFPVLEILDLSHNLLRDLRTHFISHLKVKNLDLSYNSIRDIIDFEYFPELRVLNLSNNQILFLLQSNWINTPKRLRTIDLRYNDIDCNCEHNWLNATFHFSTNVMGHCASPPEVAEMKLRKASRLLKQRCNEDGSIAASKIVRATTSSAPRRRTTTPPVEQ